MALRGTCDHDVDHVDSTAETFHIDAEVLGAWGLVYPAGQSEELTYCYACHQAVSCVVACMCGASWRDGLFEGCPWCNGELVARIVETADAGGYNERLDH